jgi:hypothetical protein
VFVADCYGILGFSAEQNRNLELMEAGRGTEYGGVGGGGGQGVVAVIFSGGFAATVDAFPAESAAVHMAVAASGSSINTFLSKNATAAYYGGLAKATFRYDPQKQEFGKTPYFFVSALAEPDGAVGTTSFTSDAKGSVRGLLDSAPAGSAFDAVALFPCFMRGKNEYGANNVEPDAVSELLLGVPVYGMFCHGELGPSRCLGFAGSSFPQKDCRQHSMTTIVAVHASKKG